MEGEKGPWDRSQGNQVTVERWDLPTPLVTVSAWADERCAVYGGEVFAVFELHDGKLKLMGEPPALQPEGALLLDGAPAFVGKESLSADGKARQLVPLAGAARAI